MTVERDMTERPGTPFNDYLESDRKRRMDLRFVAAYVGPAAVVMAGTGIAIKLDDGGPVVIQTPRTMAYREASFNQSKIRTLSVGTENDDSDVRADDKRITRVGKGIRRLGIDEFPQLISIAKGEMSAVGPRPLHPDELDKIVDTAPDRRVADDWLVARQYAKPGLTGPSQLYVHKYGGQDFYDMLSEIDYVLNADVELDHEILRETMRLPFDLMMGVEDEAR